MPKVCPVCSKQLYSYQSWIQCDTCQGLVHHDNRVRCSGLTDTEFEEHKNDPHKPFECDHCVSVKLAKEFNSVFVQLPYPVECEDFIFGKPEEKTRPDVSSISPDQLKKFVKQCDAIREHLNEASDNTEELISTSVNSNYYDIKKFNKYLLTHASECNMRFILRVIFFP